MWRSMEEHLPDVGEVEFEPCVVSFLLLWYKYQMTKATYKECVAYVSPE